VRAGSPIRFEHLVAGTGGCLCLEHASTRQKWCAEVPGQGISGGPAARGGQCPRTRQTRSAPNGRTRHPCTPSPLVRDGCERCASRACVDSSMSYAARARGSLHAGAAVLMRGADGAEGAIASSSGRARVAQVCAGGEADVRQSAGGGSSPMK
jgi:hypothetical protein